MTKAGRSSNPDPDRRKALRRGALAEIRAAITLTLKGYRIIGLRVRTPLGEIDLIARRGDLIAIVEVKARRDLTAGVDAVTMTARRRIRAAADLWLSRRADAARLSLRFDIVVVSGWAWPRHLTDAF
ncbi:putative endonuclease [Rhizobium sp. RU20A]|uniref:YraN family protein n=1 Tax=Rhizobium sp. RU20A TaxID=1907412 RepID=UPI000955C001|nr:YraN family protein [Rhizobium sp. RU20A]SIQ72600.1 putative endonuclease [Rhizobium sp. RU20A]